MAGFSIPKNVPSFSNPQRELEDRVWGASGVTARSYGRGASGVPDKIGGFFEKNRDLPMYKDKPYSYATSRRRKPLWKSKRLFALFGLFIMGVLYFLGLWGDEKITKIDRSLDWWSKADKKGGRVDWLSRRQRVVEAFELSWNAYEQYAWGRLLLYNRTLVIDSQD